MYTQASAVYPFVVVPTSLRTRTNHRFKEEGHINMLELREQQHDNNYKYNSRSDHIKQRHMTNHILTQALHLFIDCKRTTKVQGVYRIDWESLNVLLILSILFINTTCYYTNTIDRNSCPDRLSYGSRSGNTKVSYTKSPTVVVSILSM